jgi:hypothetical protein
VFTPEIKNTRKVLVVDGLISDDPKAYTIRLSTAIPFDSTGYSPVSGAQVYVTDDLDNKYTFVSKGEGNYISDPEHFKPKIGLTYTLTIETSNKIYKSSPQKLLPKEVIHDPSNFAKKINYYLTTGGELKYLMVTGTEFLTSLYLNSEPNPYFRFSNTVFIEYTQLYQSHSKDPTKDTLNYSWKKYNPNISFNLNDRKYLNSALYNHDLGFDPVDSNFYAIYHEITYNPLRDIKKDVFLYIVSFKQYHLNGDIYNYYESVNKQLDANQRIFDPVILQVSGNLKCINDPNTSVYGIFEASSADVYTYVIDRNFSTPSYRVKKIL